MKTLKIMPVLVAAILVVALAGCQQSTPQVDVDEEIGIIAALTEQWADAEARRDLAGSMAVIAEDATWLPPDAEAVEGIEAIGALYQDFFDQVPYTSLSVDPSHISVSASGDLAYSWANFKLGFDGPDGASTLTLKFLATWEKRNGEWKATSNMYNYNTPQATE